MGFMMTLQTYIAIYLAAIIVMAVIATLYFVFIYRPYGDIEFPAFYQSIFVVHQLLGPTSPRNYPGLVAFSSKKEAHDYVASRPGSFRIIEYRYQEVEDTISHE
jgi:hypothetical protein